MKMSEKINGFRKEFVYEQYTRIVEDFKDYEKITKKKMLDAIYDVYSDYNNIIDICTERELKYLRMVVENDLTPQDVLNDPQNNRIDYLDNKYDWERSILHKKFLVEYDHYGMTTIADEVLEQVKSAVKHVNWSEKKKSDKLNELLVSYCKIQGSALFHSVVSFGSAITGISGEIICKHMLYNKLFNFYVLTNLRDYEGLGEQIPIVIYHDYYYILDELEVQRRKQGIAGNIKLDTKYYKTLFYNDFDINNAKIKKFLDELKELPFFWSFAIEDIREFAMLNIDRNLLKESIANVPALEYYDLTDFFKIMDEAMDEMPSGALNGFTPNEAKKIKLEEERIRSEKSRTYVKQSNACLSKKDAKLFYKIYFGLLQFTNDKYKINSHLKIFNRTGINPIDIKEIVEKFWDNKDLIVLEFCLSNPYKFNKEELLITSDFKKGFRDMFIIAEYEEEYTAMMSKDKVYMIKGINDNIDNIVSYEQLPYVVITSIIPFKNVLIYDSLFLGTGIKMGKEFEKMVAEEYKNAMKFYHL